MTEYADMVNELTDAASQCGITLENEYGKIVEP